MKYDLLQTDFGWLYFAGESGTICLTGIGLASEAEAHERVSQQLTRLSYMPVREHWFPQLARDFHLYFTGAPTDFTPYRLDLSRQTAFQRQVLQAVRKIPTGQTKTYQEVAVSIGRPKAARAVGSCMANNRLPLLVPCHRVVGASGQLTGFSAPRGIHFKQELLELEGCLPIRGLK